MENAALARLFDELADLLEIAGENPFATRAYRSFSKTARERTDPLSALAARGELGNLPGVGKAIAAKVDAAMHTGTFPALERARAQVPASVRRFLEVPGLGPKLARSLWQDLGVSSLGELLYACEEKRLSHAPGFGPKRQKRFLESVQELLHLGGGFLLATAAAATRALEPLLLEAGAEEVVAVGAARRGVEIVRELLVLVRGIDPLAIAPAIDARPGLGGARAAAAIDGATLVVHGLPTRVRAVPRGEWIHALTVSSADERHLAWLEELAAGRLQEICAAAKSEDAVYVALGLSPVPAELREGVVETVPSGLVTAGDLGGFFHVHTDWSDGTASLPAMARAAGARGYRYLGISDHSRAASYANGLDGDRLAKQAEAVAAARREVSDVTLLHGVEVDILADGSLDLPDDVLASLDFVIASVHTKLTLPEGEMTARIVRAVSHPLVTILGHPTGRLLLGRRGYSFDLDAVARAAAANDTYLEINANAQRLDLSDELVKRAARSGARFAIDPDAHAEHAIDETSLGVLVARRAGLRRDQVLNARGEDEITSVLAARKAGALSRLRSGSRA